MRKTNLMILVVLLMLIASLSAKGEAPEFDISPKARITSAPSPSDDMWDVLFTFESVEFSMPGTVTDESNIYTTKWNGDIFWRYEMDGTPVSSFTINGVENIRDMCYDGTYVYGGDTSMTIHVLDLANETSIGTIQVTCAGITGIRHIAYDPGLDGGNGGFWIGDWDELGAVSMTGAEIYPNISGISQSCTATAYDGWTEGGPYLWMFFQIGSGVEIYQFDIANQALTGIMHDAADLPGYTTGNYAGGLDSYTNEAGMFCLMVNIQMSPNLIGVYELTIAADPESPGMPTNVIITPNAGGALEADISWVCPSVNAGGDALISLDEMRVYRDDVLFYTDTNPIIGGPGSYTDSTFPTAGIYSYQIVGYNSFGEGLSFNYECWIGEDVPAAVEDLTLEAVSNNGYLTWTNPTAGLNGGAFNNPILGYHITRYPDNVVFEVTGIATDFTDSTIPAPDYYSYTVVTYNSVGDGGSATSNAVIIGAGIEMFFDDFEAGIGNWNVINNGGDGLWMIYSPPYPNYYTLPPTSSGNVCAADSDETGAGTSTLTTLELAVPLDLSDYETAEIQFDNDWNAINSTDFCYVDVSNDGGATWNNVLTFDGNDVRETHEIIDITAYAANQPNVLIRFESVQPGWDWWWVIDNVGVYGIDETSSEHDEIILHLTKLNGNYPNPFNPTTNIAYSIKEAGKVTLEVYNIKGEKVKTLINDEMERGHHSAIWNGKNNSGKNVASGVYFYKMKARNYTSTKKMILLK